MTSFHAIYNSYPDFSHGLRSKFAGSTQSCQRTPGTVRSLSYHISPSNDAMILILPNECFSEAYLPRYSYNSMMPRIRNKKKDMAAKIAAFKATSMDPPKVPTPASSGGLSNYRFEIVLKTDGHAPAWFMKIIGQVNWKYVPTCKHVLQVWWLFLPHMTMRKPKSWTSCLWLTLWHLQFLPRPLRPQLMLWGSSSRAHCRRPLQRLPWKHQLKACQSCLWMVRMGRRWKCLGCLGVFKVPMYN